MKKLALVAAISAALTCGAKVSAQQSAPLAVAGIPGPGQRPPIGAPGPREQGLRPVTTLQGKVVKLNGNDDFTFDGFYLLIGNDSLLVKFPAHMGSQLIPVAKNGSQITVSGVVDNPPFGTPQLRMVTLTAGDKILTETFPSTPPAVEQQTVLTGSGKVSALQTDREGRVSGIFVDNRTVLRFPPHIGSQLSSALGKGSTISYSGSQKNKVQGEVQLEDYKIIRCNTITVNGQQYLVK